MPVSVAVIDVETTGLFPFRHDRVIEVAVVVIRTDGRIEREFVSLVNPQRDIGPTSIHGLTSEDVRDAPQFGEIAGSIVDAVRGAVAIAAHNVRFERQFLEHEFSRIGCALPPYHSICTMQLAGGGRLVNCCADHGISWEGEAHHAMADARAAARLLASILAKQPRAARELSDRVPIEWPPVRQAVKPPLTRDDSLRRQSQPPTYLQRLLDRMRGPAIPATDGALMAYGALLDRILEDRCIDDAEADALLETASRWGLTGDQVRVAHRDYFHQLALAAVSDGIVTEAERRDLRLVARLLGHDLPQFDAILNDAAARVANAPIRPSPGRSSESQLAGMRVCFTGELQCLHGGQRISRELASELAGRAGLVVADTITKKIDILVLADPHSQSGKARKAREYGIRIMHEPVFWKALGLEVS